MVQHPPDALLRLHPVVVPLHQLADPLFGRMVKPQAIHHAVGDPSGYHPMPHEMSHAAAIQGKALWLAHIVKQHGPPKQRFRPDGVQRMEGMLPRIVAVVGISLVKAHHGQDLRQRSACRFRILPQDRRRIRAAQQLGQLLADPLRRNVPQQFPAARQRRAGGRFDGKAQHGRNPQAAQDSQGILGKAPFRLAHAAQDSRFQIRPSFEGIIQRSPQIRRHGIDGEIPPGQILRQGGVEVHRVRVAAIGISGRARDQAAVTTVDAERDAAQLYMTKGDASGVWYDYWYPRTGDDPQLMLGGRFNSGDNSVSTTVRLENAPLISPRLAIPLGISRNPDPGDTVSTYNHSALYLEE